MDDRKMVSSLVFDEGRNKEFNFEAAMC